MSRNVIKDSQNGFSVQDQLFEEILNGFNQNKQSTNKKVVKLSSSQKIRLPKVAESYLKNEKSIGFTRTWVSNLSSCINVDDLFKRLNNFKNKRVEEDEDEEEEDAEFEEDKESFSIFKAFRLLNFIRTINDIMSAIDAIRAFNTNVLSDLANEMREIMEINNLTSQMKQVLMLEKLTKFLRTLTLPLIPKLFSIIKGFYDSEKIQGLFDKFEDWLVGTVAKEAVISLGIWGIGALLSKVTGGTSLLASHSASAARWANITVEIGRLAVAGYRMGSTISTVLDLLDFGDTDAQKWARDVAEIRDAYIAPFATSVNEFITEFENNIENLETSVVDTLEEKIMSSVDIGGVLTQLRHDRGTINKLFRLSSNFDGVNFDQSIYNEGSFTSQDNRGGEINIDDTSLTSNWLKIMHHEGEVSNQILMAHSKKWNITMSNETIERLMDENDGLRYVNYLERAKRVVETHFQYLYQNIIIYFNLFDKESVRIIDEKVNSDVYKKYTEAFFDDTGVKIAHLIEGIIGKSVTPPPRRNPSSNQSPDTSQPESNNVKVWRLSQKTLQPFFPMFINNALVGFEIALTNPIDEEVKLKVPRFHQYITWVDFGPLAYFNIESMRNNYDTYVGIFQQFEQNAKIIEHEFETEKETNELVTEIFNTITAKINEIKPK